MTTTPKNPCAIACSLGGNVSKRIDCAFARSPPPPRPWMTRAMTSVVSDVAMPHITDDIVKATSEKTKYHFLPKRWPSHAVIGKMMTFATA